jgi:hypothetical protein
MLAIGRIRGVVNDTRGIKTTAGDFAQDELAKRAVKIVADVATEYKKWADGRQFIAFAAGVDHAEALAKEMGPDVAVLVGSTPAEQRDRILAMLAIGRIRGVVNVAVLIEGWDPESDHKRALKLFRGDPEYVPVSVAIDCRPTQSLCLYMQGPMGRNMRTHPRKDRALYLGHAGNTARHKGMPRAHEGFSLTRAMDAARTRVAIPQAPTAQIMVCGRCLTVQEPPMCLRCKIPLAGAPLRRVEQVAGELRRVGGGEVVVDVTAMVAFLASFRRLGLNRDAAAARWQQQHGRAPDGAAWVKACEQVGMR